MSVGRICRREVHVAAQGENALDVARRMREHNLGTVVVLDDDRRPTGIVTDRDLAMRVVAEDRRPGSTPVGDVMSLIPRTVSEETTIEHALEIMRSRGHRRLPVVKDGRLVGIVTLDDVLALLAEEMREVGKLVHGQEPAD
jgi:CBS domain-containing protein